MRALCWHGKSDVRVDTVPDSKIEHPRDAASGSPPAPFAGRTCIDTGTDKRYVRRDSQGQFTESDDVGRSLAADKRTKAKTVVKSGQGDRGDQKRQAKR